MKYNNRRNYQSSSYTPFKVILDNVEPFKDREISSTKYSKIRNRPSKVTEGGLQTKNYIQDRPSVHGRYSTTKSMSKLGYAQTSYLKSDLEIKQKNLKQNRDHKVKHRLYAPMFQTVKHQIIPRETKPRNSTEYFRYYKYSIGGHKGKPNQDRVFCGENTYIICDGHGPEGGTVSSFVGQQLLHYSLINKNQRTVNQKSISRIFDYTNEDLEDEGVTDLQVSGSTALMVQIVNNTIYCANSGDCRAIMSRKGTVVELNNQHKPDRLKERQRIFRYGGSIKKNGNGPYRLYNPERKYGVGGLAVSRGFGDTALKGWGMIYEPQILKFQLDYGVQFIVIGSDGFFQFFPPEDVVSYTYKLLRNRSINLAEDLVQQSIKKWIGFDQTDDISCVVILF